jgi:pectate lyase
MIRRTFGLFTALATLLQACSGTSQNNPSNGAAGAPAAAGSAGSASAEAGSAGASAGGAPSSAGSANSGGSGGLPGSAGSAVGGAASAGAPGNGGASDNPSTTCGSSGPVTVTKLAFPEAEGFGQHATGGRTGKVYHVTTLADSGPGSFRDAVSQSNRIVVFDVGGYIALKTAVSAKSNLTIAGQSAPGGGIGFKGGEISFANSSNVILRYVRIRPGSDTASTEDDALSLYRAKNVIVDHCSLEFAPWNNIDGVSDDWQNYPVTDITFQDSLIADPTGQQFGAHTESVSSQWSWYRNIFANSHNRNPLAKVDNVFVNNVLYNCSAGYTTHTSTTFRHDIINNYFIFGPASTGTDNTWYQLDKNQSVYAAGNLKDTNLNGALDGAATSPYWYQGTGTVLGAPWSGATAPYSAQSAYRINVSQAGALPRDPLDALIVSQVRTLGKGATGSGANSVGPSGALYTSQTETGLPNNGYGDIASGSSPADSDHDGMPDFWEKPTARTRPWTMRCSSRPTATR